MRILLVQLSDIHCKNHDTNYTMKVQKAVDALKPHGKVDGAALIFSGDLADKSQRNEFAVGRKILGSFVSKLDKSFQCGKIPTLIIPGNHDMHLPKGCRGIAEILTWDRAEHLEEECDRLSNFFEYAQSKGCFRNNRLYDVRTVSIGPAKVQFCLLNTAPYSTREKDNKEVHYFPALLKEKMRRDESADLKISVMHHSYEWFDWESKQMLKQSFEEDDLVFIGHDHLAESLTIQNATGRSMNLIMGGEFALETGKDCSFNAVVYDDGKKCIERYEYIWHADAELFTEAKRGIIPLGVSSNVLAPSEEYLDKLLADKQNLSARFTDYYVLPRLIAEGETFSEDAVEQIDVDKIFSALINDAVISISGGDGSGKSSLLKYLYYESINRGFYPLFIEKRKNHDSRLDKMFRDLFESQYGNIEYGYDRYIQSDFEKRIVFVDDFDLIKNDKVRENLFEYIISRGGLLIYTTSDYYQQNLAEAVKERLQGKTIGSLKITPFYKETRDKLVSAICTLHQFEEQEPQPIIVALDYMVQCQANFISLTPNNLIQHIKYFLNSKNREEKGSRTITLVFETNIRNAILDCVKETDATPILSALEFIAYDMYFKQTAEVLQLSKLEELIAAFNTQRRAKLNTKTFMNNCIKAGIMVEAEDAYEYSFTDNNTYAYFIAKYLNRALERDPSNQSDILFVMNRICFGINDTIILFLSYIRSNTRIILNIALKAVDLLEKYPELNFKENNIPFVKQINAPSTALPTEKEKKASTRQTEKIEMARQEAVKFKGIFDYNECDVEKDKYRVLRAFKYTQLIGRTLVDQYGDLENEDLDIMIQCLYTLPQKVLYAVLKQHQDHYEKTVAELQAFVKENLPDENISIDDIKMMLGEAAVNFILNIMNDIAYNSSNSSTITVLNEFELSSSNYVIQNLMMVENTGNSSAFVEMATDVYSAHKEDYFIQWLVRLITRKHLINTPNIDYRLVDKLFSKEVLNQRGKKTFLIEQNTEEKS